MGISINNKLLEEIKREMLKRATNDIRYYFTVVGNDYVTIYDRTIHKPIVYLNNLQDVSLWIDKLNAMDENEYLNMIFSKGLFNNNQMDNSEEWFLKAWIYETDKILVKLRKDIVTTSIQDHQVKELYTKYLTQKKREDYKNENNKAICNTHQIRPLKETAQKEDGESNKTLPKKKLIKKSSKGTEKETKSLQTLLDELLKLKQESKISFGDYVRQKRKLIELHA